MSTDLAGEGRSLDFTALSPKWSVSQALMRLKRGHDGLIVDVEGKPLACVSKEMLQSWPPEQILDGLRSEWPALYALPEVEALSVQAVARFFRDDLLADARLVSVILVDTDGRPSAILRRQSLLGALGAVSRETPTTRSADTPAKGHPVSRPLRRDLFDFGMGDDVAPAPGPGDGEGVEPSSEGDLMVTRYGRLSFPAQAPLFKPALLQVTINREQIPGSGGQIELGLTARQWPLRVVASLVGVRPGDFIVEGPVSGVIEVLRMADSIPLTFTLIPQSLGQKKIRVRFEQDNAYLGTAIIETTIVVPESATAGQAAIRYPPSLSARGQPPDRTIYIEQIEPLRYAVRLRSRDDDPASPPRDIDQIDFPKAPDAFVEDILTDLNAKTKAGLSAKEFDDAVKNAGTSLYEKLFIDRRSGNTPFHDFYWEHMYQDPLTQIATLQIVSDEPYIPWELLRPSRRRQDGTWEVDPLFLCQRFALSRWLGGPGFAGKLPLLRVALVMPPSNLVHVQEEIDAIKALPGLRVQLIQEKGVLQEFLKTGEADVLHFACHGRFNADVPERSVIFVGDRHFLPGEVTGESRNFGRLKPLVFVNACDSGRLGIGLTGLDGWATAFLDANAGFFIGSVWKTTDALASKFAVTFYERLLTGDSIAEAMRQARVATVTPGDATFLSYTLYANPTIRAMAAQVQRS